MAAVLWFVSRLRSFRELLATGGAECAALVDAMASAAPLGRAPGVVSAIEANEADLALFRGQGRKRGNLADRLNAWLAAAR